MTHADFDQRCQQLNLTYRLLLNPDATYSLAVASPRYLRATGAYQTEVSSRVLSQAFALAWERVREQCPKARGMP